MSSFLQVLLSGVTCGLIYALNAISAYLLIVIAKLPYLLAFVIIVLALGLLGVVIEMFLFRRLKANLLTLVFASIALGWLISGIALESFGQTSVAVPGFVSGSVSIFGAFLSLDKLVIVFISLAIVLALHFFFKLTKAGRAIRAVSQDSDAAQLAGIRVNRTNSLTFFLALAVAGAAGVLIAPLYYVDVFIGTPVLTTTLIVVVLGGLGSFPGAIAGGLFIGLLSSFGYAYLGGITTLLSFCVVIVVLIFRPYGMFGKHE
jgi:branched-chain amino acid transport system permease protein